MKLLVSMPTRDPRRLCQVSYLGGRLGAPLPASEAEKLARRFLRAGDRTAHVILTLS